MVGNAGDPRSTLSALTSLKRNGRLVLMGSMTVDLPLPYMQVMLNNWEIIGQFMYPPSAYRRLLDLVRSGLLDLGAIKPKVFALHGAARGDGGGGRRGEHGSRRDQAMSVFSSWDRPRATRPRELSQYAFTKRSAPFDCTRR